MVRMGGSAFGTDEPQDAEPDGSAGILHRTVIIAMDGKASMMAAGTLQLVKLEAVDDGIVKFFGNIVAIFDGDGYHSIIADLSACRKSVGYDSRKARGGVSCYQSI